MRANPREPPAALPHTPSFSRAACRPAPPRPALRKLKPSGRRQSMAFASASTSHSIKCSTPSSPATASVHRAPDVTLNSIDADDPEISDYHLLPDTEALAGRLRSALALPSPCDAAACWPVAVWYGCGAGSASEALTSLLVVCCFLLVACCLLLLRRAGAGWRRRTGCRPTFRWAPPPCYAVAATHRHANGHATGRRR
eukprot:SAG11_NODE_9329_length_921_cov_1.819951_1_plen_197_part_10